VSGLTPGDAIDITVPPTSKWWMLLSARRTSPVAASIQTVLPSGSKSATIRARSTCQHRRGRRSPWASGVESTTRTGSEARVGAAERAAKNRAAPSSAERELVAGAVPNPARCASPVDWIDRSVPSIAKSALTQPPITGTPATSSRKRTVILSTDPIWPSGRNWTRVEDQRLGVDPVQVLRAREGDPGEVRELRVGSRPERRTSAAAREHLQPTRLRIGEESPSGTVLRKERGEGRAQVRHRRRGGEISRGGKEGEREELEHRTRRPRGNGGSGVRDAPRDP